MLPDNYAKARAKAKVAEETSDLQSEVEQTSRRQRKEKERPLSSDTDESDSILPAPPVLQTNKKLVTNMKSNENLNLIESAENIPINNNYGIIENQETTTTTEIYLKRIIEQQHLLRILLTDVLTRVEIIKKHLKTKSNSSGERTSIFQGNILFPINSEEELQKLETHLQDENNFRDTVINNTLTIMPYADE
ncbi:uncharacterized protein LOC143376468 [Andrena cerasifolii]|uniref:uncharacterized protein LOC143376468 n=1 Tax=Andrena cerasifolii TaxID=2819439 RepID=UPI0040384ECE